YKFPAESNTSAMPGLYPSEQFRPTEQNAYKTVSDQVPSPFGESSKTVPQPVKLQSVLELPPNAVTPYKLPEWSRTNDWGQDPSVTLKSYNTLKCDCENASPLTRTVKVKICRILFLRKNVSEGILIILSSRL